MLNRGGSFLHPEPKRQPHGVDGHQLDEVKPRWQVIAIVVPVDEGVGLTVKDMTVDSSIVVHKL